MVKALESSNAWIMIAASDTKITSANGDATGLRMRAKKRQCDQKRRDAAAAARKCQYSFDYKMYASAIAETHFSEGRFGGETLAVQKRASALQETSGAVGEQCSLLPVVVLISDS